MRTISHGAKIEPKNIYGGGWMNAWMSFVSDMRKHDGTAHHIAPPHRDRTGQQTAFEWAYQRRAQNEGVYRGF